jgi:hypothetical protein
MTGRPSINLVKLAGAHIDQAIFDDLARRKGIGTTADPRRIPGDPSIQSNRGRRAFTPFE